MLSAAEENYLKAIFSLADAQAGGFVKTNSIANKLNTKAASVTDMLKRLFEKDLVSYQKYQGVKLTSLGEKFAKQMIRKHRLWEVFLATKLKFNWDEVHDIAEQLEHTQSEELTDRLEEFLGFPTHDPHGDPIPDKDGNFAERYNMTLADILPGTEYVVVGVKEHTAVFLNYLDKISMVLGTTVSITLLNEYDNSRDVVLNQHTKQSVSYKVAKNVLVAVKTEQDSPD